MQPISQRSITPPAYNSATTLTTSGQTEPPKPVVSQPRLPLLSVTGQLQPGKMTPFEAHESSRIQPSASEPAASYQNLAFSQMPDWLKPASPEAQAQHKTLLGNWRTSLATLERTQTRASPPGLMRESLQAQIIADLGYELDPDQLEISTERFVPVNGDTYQQTRSLTQLGLDGLQAGDDRSGSDFQRTTTLSYQGAPLDPGLDKLTVSYITRLFSKLPTPAQLREAQLSAQSATLFDTVARERLQALAHGALLRGQINTSDFQATERLVQAGTSNLPADIQVSTLTLNGDAALKDILIISHGNGDQQRWLLFTPGAPREQQWQWFNSQYRLMQEVVSWSADDTMVDWLVQLAVPEKRPGLASTMARLRESPYPSPRFFGLNNHKSFAAAVTETNRQDIADARKQVMASAPDWYVDASPKDRQELTRLNESLTASVASVDRLTRPVESFESYLHDKADQKINSLLGMPKGSVDPDSIIVTTPRETLTYTQLLRDGYDDNLGLLKATADTSATFSGPPGVDLSKLTAGSVAGSVRGTWTGDSYIALLKSKVLNPQADDYVTRRSNTIDLMQLQLKAAALTSRLKKHISAEQASWLATSLANLDDPNPTARKHYPVVPLQINVPAPQRYHVNKTRTETLAGLYVFTQPDARGAPEHLIYTPNAPDGLLFRDYQQFRGSLAHPGMATYYQQRASAGSRHQAGQGIDALRRGAALAPLPAQPTQDLRDLFYDDAHNRAIQNVEETTVSRAQMVRKLTATSLELIATGLLLPVQAAVALSAIKSVGAVVNLARTSLVLDLISIGGGSAQLLKSTQQTAGALSKGQDQEAKGEALQAVLNGLFLLLDVYSVGTAGKSAKQLAGALKGGDAVKSLAALNTPAIPAGMVEVALDGERFLVNSSPNALGHFELYRQRTEGNLASTGQFVQQEPPGHWSRTGLRGGAPKGRLEALRKQNAVEAENPNAGTNW